MAASRLGKSLGAVVVLAVALTVGSLTAGPSDPAPPPARTAVADPARLGGADLDRAVASLQTQLHTQPKDFGSWAALGTAYVEQARLKGDPSRYPLAQRALARSLDLRPGYDAALAGQAALAAARHDFEDALRLVRSALTANPYNERALALRIDALVELGRDDEAWSAARQADARRPGIPVFTRYAYVLELRGDTKQARSVLTRALASASSPADRAYVATELGQLARRQGDYKAALAHYGTALQAAPAYLPALEGRARASAASGRTDAAIRDLREVVRKAPLPGSLVMLGELYEVTGRTDAAREQYALVDAWVALARANGVATDLEVALAGADHGDRKAALTAARAEWDHRETVHTADALAWALHANGRSQEALPYARRATATGFKDASFLYHRGAIEAATDRDAMARRSLSAALELDPGFSPTGARDARELLARVGGAK
ncbi:tetratricopeptide repeat protein [Streptomyces sp. TRM66268-LWL]|uniref:Tetratricopeptide repeat protein n=1 Tax=Streptomyces polyasparticus TaxID=2767826 RepID=A0ABR7SK24_9ACTN|nr:tetratricopeptide repeat protein [Streptomyces polyasparticus]MBC9715367.1 tetratricopeptide repeat protein [Streptomyces polyasparticus]